MTARNETLSQILVALGGGPQPHLSRNKILEAIGIALGGTVTDPSNRNALLQDCLNAINNG